jgi:hypothetical protein
MQGIARGPIRVTQEAVVTNERQTGFQGIRKIMVEHSVRVIVPFQGVVQPEWRPTEWIPAGNSVQCLNRAVAVLHNRANPAFSRRGAS